MFNFTAIRRRKWGLISGTSAAAIGALLLWGNNEKAPAAVVVANPAIPVEVAAVKRADVPVYLQGLGTVQAFNTDTVTTRVDGQLQSIDFVDGQNVKAGDTLAQIDPRPYQATYDQAVATKAKDEAQLANARTDLARYQALWDQNAIAQQLLTTQRAPVAQLTAQAEMDQASIDGARTNLQYATIRSPIAGRAGIRQVDMGNNLLTTANTNIVVITQMQPIAVTFTLPEDDLPAVARAIASHSLAATALARDGNTELDHSTVVVLDNEVNQSSGTLKLKATFPNLQEKLWPGDFVNVKLLVGTEKGALTVPSAAIQRGPDGQFVYVVKPGATVAIRQVSLDRFERNVAAIRADLPPGTLVVTAGQYRLQSGAKVAYPKAALAQLRPQRKWKRG